MTLDERVTELFKNGLHCSQILHIIGQEQRGEEEPAAISAMGGLASGMYAGLNCGSLTGGACLIASYCARGGEDDEDKCMYKGMVLRLVDWFNSTFGAVNCSELVSSDRLERLGKCPNIVSQTFTECMKILEENGIDTRE